MVVSLASGLTKSPDSGVFKQINFNREEKLNSKWVNFARIADSVIFPRVLLFEANETHFRSTGVKVASLASSLTK